jgi:hypothetical protein
VGERRGLQATQTKAGYARGERELVKLRVPNLKHLASSSGNAQTFLFVQQVILDRADNFRQRRQYNTVLERCNVVFIWCVFHDGEPAKVRLQVTTWKELEEAEEVTS